MLTATLFPYKRGFFPDYANAIIMYMRFYLSLIAFICLVSGCTAEQSSTSPDAVNDFLQGSNKAAIIKFYAPWCATCNEYAPEFAKAQEAFGDKVDFYSVDIDQKPNKRLIKEFKISRIPVTIFVSKDRTQIEREMGPLSFNELKAKVNGLLTSN